MFVLFFVKNAVIFFSGKKATLGKKGAKKGTITETHFAAKRPLKKVPLFCGWLLEKSGGFMSRASKTMGGSSTELYLHRLFFPAGMLT